MSNRRDEAAEELGRANALIQLATRDRDRRVEFVAQATAAIRRANTHLSAKRARLVKDGPAGLQRELDSIHRRNREQERRRRQAVNEAKRRVQSRSIEEWIEEIRKDDLDRRTYITVRTPRRYRGLRLDGSPDFTGGTVYKIKRPVRRRRYTGLGESLR